MKEGFTVIEVLVVLFILGLVAALGWSTFYDYQNKQGLDKAVDIVIATLNHARSLTLASKDDARYGVHLEAAKLVVFKGDTYNASDLSNEFTNLDSHVNVSQISLSGGGSDILFERLTGKTSQSGSIVLAVVADPTSIKVINVYGTGIIEPD